MVYGVILAGGVGSRMGGEKPKQYLNLKNRPIIIHTAEKMVTCPEFEKIIILCPAKWVQHTKNLVCKHLPRSMHKVVVIEGGETRNETIMKAVDYIDEQGKLDDRTIIVTHDSVRPFITRRIIRENIEACRRYGACDTVVPATDTIIESQNGREISAVPDRSLMFQGQTPQSFRAKLLRELYNELTQEEKNVLTDAAKIFVLKGHKVALVRGEIYNTKITYPYDLRVTRTLLNDDNEYDEDEYND